MRGWGSCSTLELAALSRLRARPPRSLPCAWTTARVRCRRPAPTRSGSSWKLPACCGVRPANGASHPLLGPALLAGLAPARLRRLHTLAAGFTVGTQPAAIVRQLRHRIAAADGCDDGLAGEIEDAAEDPGIEVVAAGRLLVSAAALTTGRSERLRRLLRGIGRLQAAGCLAEADEQLGAGETLARTPGERARISDLRVEAEALSGSPLTARDTLLRLASDTAMTDPDGAALRYMRSASISVASGELGLARTAVVIARELGTTGAVGDAIAGLVGVLTDSRSPDSTAWPAGHCPTSVS